MKKEYTIQEIKEFEQKANFKCDKCGDRLIPVDFLKDGRCVFSCPCSPNKQTLLFTEFTVEELETIKKLIKLDNLASMIVRETKS